MAGYEDVRAAMVNNQLRTVDVTDIRLLEAMELVPRELFVPAARKSLAYSDLDLKIKVGATAAEDRYMLAPGPFAKLLQLAEIRDGDVVLVVGCGNGYAAAIVAQLAGSVVALEEDSDLSEAAAQNLVDLEIDNAAIVTGPLVDGWKSEAPYDAIFVNGAVERLPDALVGQVKEDGRLVAIEGTGKAARAQIYLKTGASFSGRFGFNAAAPMLPGFAVEPAFEF